MRLGLLVVLAVISIMLLVPLWFAWLSTTPRRWARVERVLGKEYTAGAAPSWLWKVYAGLVPLQAVMALLAFGSLRNPMLGWLASAKRSWSGPGQRVVFGSHGRVPPVPTSKVGPNAAGEIRALAATTKDGGLVGPSPPSVPNR